MLTADGHRAHDHRASPKGNILYESKITGRSPSSWNMSWDQCRWNKFWETPFRYFPFVTNWRFTMVLDIVIKVWSLKGMCCRLLGNFHQSSSNSKGKAIFDMLISNGAEYYMPEYKISFNYFCVWNTVSALCSLLQLKLNALKFPVPFYRLYTSVTFKLFMEWMN